MHAAEALGKLGDKSLLPVLIDEMESFQIEPRYALVALKWICSKPDEVRLSQTKDKLKVHSAFEWNKRGSDLAWSGKYLEAKKCFEKAVEIDPDWKEPKRAL